MIKELERLIETDPVFEMGKEEGKIEGKLEGKIEGKIEGELIGQLKVGIKILLDHKFDDDTIMDFTGLTMDQVEKLRRLVDQYGAETVNHLATAFGL